MPAETSTSDIHPMAGMAWAAAQHYRDEETRKRSDIKANFLDSNPLLFPPALLKPEHVDAIKDITLQAIGFVGGLEPIRFESTMVENVRDNPPSRDQRMVVRFETESFREKQITLLEDLTRKTYGPSSRTTTTSDGKAVLMENYYPTSLNEARDTSKRHIILGWYMGSNVAQTDSLHQGIFFYRDIGDFTRSNLVSRRRGRDRYIIEIREAALTQLKLVQLITQVSSILGKGELPDAKDLSYQIYSELMRPGLRVSMVDKAYGTERVREQIRRGLFLPLGNPEAASELELEAESVLQIGPWGTGKTLNALSFMLEDTGTFIVPVSPEKLAQDLATEPSKQVILPALDRVHAETGRPIVLLIDDIEIIASADNPLSSAFLNLMAGVRARGLYILSSTNQPEKINPALLQPQRFGIIIYTGIQPPEANFHILDLHTPTDIEDGKSLFSSEAEKRIILEEIALLIQGYPPRQIAQIPSQAKANLLERVALTLKKGVGLTSLDLAGKTFTLDDWVKAYETVSKAYDAEATRERSDELAEFVAHQRKIAGFDTKGQGNGKLSQRIKDRIAQQENGS